MDSRLDSLVTSNASIQDKIYIIGEVRGEVGAISALTERLEQLALRLDQRTGGIESQILRITSRQDDLRISKLPFMEQELISAKEEIEKIWRKISYYMGIGLIVGFVATMLGNLAVQFVIKLHGH